MSWNCRGKLFTFEQPKVMGIVNCTPDSFYEKSRTNSASAIEELISKHVEEGADIIDIGGYSTRPGAKDIDIQDEWNRIQPAIQFAKANFPDIFVSVDTFRAEIAERSCSEGADIINDISAGLMDENMFKTVSKQRVPMILMHMRGTPQTMMENTNYSHLTSEVLSYFSERIARAREAGIVDLAIDPGFGFSKTLEQNYEIFRELDQFQLFNHPLLIGVSRKSMIYKLLNTTPEESLNGTTTLHALALQKGAKILRVHDVKEATQSITLMNLN